MELTITLEQALEKASPRLREKMLHSVELVRKSEKLALKYDSESGFAVGFSGGKDSQAVYHIMQLASVKFWAQFSPTSVDPPEVIRFIKKEYPEVGFRKLKTNIYKRAVEIGCLPTMRIRWCCAEFKENAFPNKVTVVGVRKAESAKRAKRNEIEVTSHKFSGDLDEFDLWSEKQRQRIEEKVKNLNQDQFSEPKGENTVRCVGGQDSIIVMPILYWTDEDVWEFLNKVVEVPHCSLYNEGRKRIGCIMCPFASAKNTYADIKRWPHVYRKWVGVVKQLRGGGTTQDSSEYLRTSLIGGGVYRTSKIAKFADRLCHPEVLPAKRPIQPNGNRETENQRADTGDRKAISTPNGEGGSRQSPFLPSPTGEGYINTPEELIVHWWISKLPFKQWYAKYIQQQTLNFDE